MATYELQPDEVILYEGNVTCKTYKGSLQLTLTSQKVVFEKEKGLFKKERELVDVIPLESVKLYNDAAQIKQKGADVEVQTVGKNMNNTINTNISFYSHPFPMIGSLCVPLSYFSKNKYTISM